MCSKEDKPTRIQQFIVSWTRTVTQEISVPVLAFDEETAIKDAKADFANTEIPMVIRIRDKETHNEGDLKVEPCRFLTLVECSEAGFTIRPPSKA